MSQVNPTKDFRGLFIGPCQHETETSQTWETTYNFQYNPLTTLQNKNPLKTWKYNYIIGIINMTVFFYWTELNKVDYNWITIGPVKFLF